MSIVELREYTITPGMRDAWVDYMKTTIIPYQQSKGVVVLGQFVAAESEDSFVWMRSFADEEERARLTKEVYGSPEWTEGIAPTVKQYLAPSGVKVTVLNPVDSGADSWIAAVRDTDSVS